MEVKKYQGRKKQMKGYHIYDAPADINDVYMKLSQVDLVRLLAPWSMVGESSGGGGGGAEAASARDGLHIQLHHHLRYAVVEELEDLMTLAHCVKLFGALLDAVQQVLQMMRQIMREE